MLLSITAAETIPSGSGQKRIAAHCARIGGGGSPLHVAGLDDGRLGVFDLPGNGRLLFGFFLHGDSPSIDK